MPRIKGRSKRRWVLAGLGAAILAAGLTCLWGLPLFWKMKYQPQRGDILFQSLPSNDLVDAIEGITGSPFSHCGVVIKKGGRWFVREAIGDVVDTELFQWIGRGREFKFAAFRLAPENAHHLEKFLEATEKYLGRPYDIRYRMDDEYIYCSELVYKSYRDATGGRLGELKDLREMNWRPFKETIERYEGGPVPDQRLMITPKHLALAGQLRLVFENGMLP